MMASSVYDDDGIIQQQIEVQPNRKEVMHAQQLQFGRDYMQIITGVNRIRYLKNKQIYNHSKMTDHLFKIVRSLPKQQKINHKLVTTHQTLLPHSQPTSDNAGFRCTSNPNGSAGLRESQSLALMKVYTSRHRLRDMRMRVHQEIQQTEEKNYSKCYDFNERKNTDITDEPSADSNSGFMSSHLRRSKPSKAKLKELMERKALNYQEMKQQRKLHQEHDKNMRELQRTRAMQRKRDVCEQKGQGRKKMEQHYFRHIQEIHQQKEQKRANKMRASARRTEEIMKLRQQEFQGIELFQKSLLIEDHLKNMIQQQIQTADQNDKENKNRIKKRNEIQTYHTDQSHQK